jgi:hypothetical protein
LAVATATTRRRETMTGADPVRTYTATHLTIDITTHDVASAIEAARTFLDEIARYDEPVRGTYSIGRDGADPVGTGTLADCEVAVRKPPNA